VKEKNFCSIIICTHNSEKTIRGTLESVFRESDIEKEVIVVDDASTDRTVTACEEYPIKIYKVEKNSGPAYCRNIGARNSGGSILFWIDSDVRFEKGLLSAILAKMEKYPEVAGVGSISSPVPLNKGFFSRYFALEKYHLYMDMLGKEKIIIVPLIDTRCGSIKKEVFEELGGFDEYYVKPSIEDYEFSSRMRGKYAILYDRDLINKHFFPDSRSKIFKRLFSNSYLLSQLITSKKVKSVHPFTSDALSRATIILSIFLLLGGLFFRPFLFAALIVHSFAVFKKRRLLRMFYNSENIFFMLRSWRLYCVSSIFLFLGLTCGFIQQCYANLREK